MDNNRILNIIYNTILHYNKVQRNIKLILHSNISNPFNSNANNILFHLKKYNNLIHQKKYNRDRIKIYQIIIITKIIITIVLSHKIKE